MTETNDALIEVKDLNLYFGNYHVLKDINISMFPGELIGLVGDNGAGKTTLINVISGIHTPTSGQVYFNGRKIKTFHPKLAIELGIETIQQAVGLCDNLSIARNYYLGREPSKKILGIPFLNFVKMREAGSRVIRNFGLRANISSDDEVSVLSGGERQSIKIGRSVELKNRVIIMDEPTNHLSVREREHVNELAQQMRDQNLLVIYITHDIFQVHRIADRIVILENGEKITDVKKEEMEADELEGIIRHGGRVCQDVQEV